MKRKVKRKMKRELEEEEVRLDKRTIEGLMEIGSSEKGGR